MKLLINISGNRKAFSIIEIAIVLLITSLVILASIKATNLIQKSKISRANSLTKNSPLLQFEDIFLWLETTTELSLDGNEAENYEDLSANDIAFGKGSITKWYDRNPNPVIRRNATSSTARPKYYYNCLNNIPCLKFDDNNFLQIENSQNHSLSDYSIFIVEKKSSSAAMPIISSDSSSSINQSIEIGYSGSNEIYWGQGDSSAQKFFTSDILSKNNVNVHLFINATNKSNSSNLKYYLNGTQISQSNPASIVDFANTTFGSALQIGKSGSSYYNGSIGEIIILPYAIPKNQRVALTHYLKKKWGIK